MLLAEGASDNGAEDGQFWTSETRGQGRDKREETRGEPGGRERRRGCREHVREARESRARAVSGSRQA